MKILLYILGSAAIVLGVLFMVRTVSWLIEDGTIDVMSIILPLLCFALGFLWITRARSSKRI